MSGNGGGKKSPKFPELPPKYSVSREWRNKAEKLRRNRLNEYLSDVKTLTPIVAEKTKKSETTKTNVLRAAASYIRLNQMYPNNEESPQPIKKAVNHVEAMKGVVFLLSQTGRILFIGEKIESYIGYSQLELVGVSILDYTHPGDKSKLMRNLERRPPVQTAKGKLAAIGHDGAAAKAPSPGFSSSANGSGGGGQHLVPFAGPSSSGGGGQGNGQTADNNLDADWTRRRSFYVRLKEKPQKQNPDRAKYEHMHILGHLRDATDAEKKLTKDLEFVFVGMMKTVKDRPIFELNLMDAVQDQYITRHLPDGRIIFSDHRISSIAGYMPDDVRGHSAFNFMVGDDLPWTTLALRTMFASSTREGLVVYRLKTAFGGEITLQSRGYLEVNKDDQKIEHFVCINTLIRPEDSGKYLEEQQQRFKPIISNLQNYSLNKLPQLITGPSQIRNKSGKRKLPTDTANMPSKYRVLDNLLAGMSSAQVFASNETGTCLRLATSVIAGGSSLSGISRSLDNQTPSSIGAKGEMNNEDMESHQGDTNSSADNPDAAATADNSSEIVSLLQELRPEEIVSMLRKKGIKLATSSSPSTTMTEQNIVQQQNVIVMSQDSGQQQPQQSPSSQFVQSRLMSPLAEVDDVYNVDSIDPSVMEVITEVDGYAAENVRQNLNSSRQNSNSSRQNLLQHLQQSVLQRTAGPASNQSRGRIDPSINQTGARTGVINQSGGVLRSSSGKLFSVEKGDVNRNVTDSNSLLETTQLKVLPGNYQSLPGSMGGNQHQAAGVSSSMEEQYQDGYNRLSDNFSQGASSGERMRLDQQPGEMGRLIVRPGSVGVDGRILSDRTTVSHPEEARINLVGDGGRGLNKTLHQDSASPARPRTIRAAPSTQQQQQAYNSVLVCATPSSSTSQHETGFNPSFVVQNDQLLNSQSIVQQVTCQSMMTGAQSQQQQHIVYTTAAAVQQQQQQQGQVFPRPAGQQQKDNQQQQATHQPTGSSDFEMFEIPDFGSLVSDGSGES